MAMEQAKVIHINTENDIALQLYNDAEEMVEAAIGLTRYTNITIATISDGTTSTVLIIDNKLL